MEKTSMAPEDLKKNTVGLAVGLMNAVRLGFTETMRGTHTFAKGERKGERHPFSFTLECRSTEPLSFFNPQDGQFLTLSVTGRVDAGELADEMPVTGTLTLRYVSDHKIYYDFGFKGDDGSLYRFRGEKRDIQAWNVWKTHFVCYGAVFDSNDERLSEVEVTFDYRDLPTWLQSFHLARG